MGFLARLAVKKEDGQITSVDLRRLPKNIEVIFTTKTGSQWRLTKMTGSAFDKESEFVTNTSVRTNSHRFLEVVPEGIYSVGVHLCLGAKFVIQTDPDEYPIGTGYVSSIHIAD